MLKRKKKEQKISLKTKNLKHKIRKNKNKEKDIFDNIPKLLDILVPDCINEKMDQIILHCCPRMVKINFVLGCSIV